MKDAWLVISLAVGYVIGGIPFSNITAHLTNGVDLRHVGTGSVNPSNLYTTCGLRPAVVATALEVAKGTVGPALVNLGHGHQLWAAVAGALAVTGHNWSPFLKGAGGRGLSTATGALWVVTWPAALVMCSGLLVGAFVRRIIPAMGIALLALVPVLVATRGLQDALAASIVVAPIGAKTAVLMRRRWIEKRSTPEP